MKSRRSWFAAALSLLVTAPACKKDDSYVPPAPTPTVTIAASATSVVADGDNTVTLTLTNTTGAAVTVTTTRGTFASGGTSFTTSQASATIVLVACNASVQGCAGPAVVTAIGTQTASVTVTFGALADMCQADCSVDLACGTPVGLACVGASGAGTCSATNPPACIASGGGGGGGGGTQGPSVTVTPARTKLPATGSATTQVVVQVTDGTAPTSGATVTLSTNLGSISPTSGTTDADGKVTATFSAGSATGVATITATVTSTTPNLTGTAAIAIPRLGALQIPQKAAQYTAQGARGSGWNEIGWVQVQALDEQGNPYPDGLTVRFEHRPLGGSTFTEPATSGTCATWTGCVLLDATTTSGTGPADSAGLATAWLRSGTVAGTLELVATATAGGVTRTALLPTVAVVGAKASAANFSVVCSPRDVPALAETDCSISLVDAPFTCMASLKDRYGNVLGRSTQVVFASEASAIFPVTATPAYDPTATPPLELGTAVQRFETLGSGLPFDVPVQAGEPSVSHGLDGCGPRTHNPRDGAVTIVAIADGEESFFDVNGNGVYDRGSDTVGLTTSEPFVDQGEPFVDVNDNGQWDAGEWFFDVDGNGAYTPRNGVWDASTKIWTQTVVVYTGAPATVAIPGALVTDPFTYLGTRWADGTFAGACTSTAAPAALHLAVQQPGPPAVPGESATYYVVASDMNLNRLHVETGYGVSPVVGDVKAKYWGFAKYADDLGFFYRYWPCDQAATPVCASQCRSTANLPCVMRPSVSGFGCGIAAEVTVEAGTTAGAASVEWTVTTPYARYGLGQTVIAKERLAGVTH